MHDTCARTAVGLPVGGPSNHASHGPAAVTQFAPGRLATGSGTRALSDEARDLGAVGPLRRKQQRATGVGGQTRERRLQLAI